MHTIQHKVWFAMMAALTAEPRLGPMAGLPSGLPSVAFAPMGCAFCPSTAFCPSGANLQQEPSAHRGPMQSDKCAQTANTRHYHTPV